ncbi:MAG: cation transporter [Ginsengibacter sp.]
MTHTYSVSGMTCNGCQAKVQKLLSAISGVNNVSIDLPKGEATIDMATHISTFQLKSALKDYPKYQLEEKQSVQEDPVSLSEEETKTWMETYKPLLVIFAYIIGVTVSIEISRGAFILETWMQNFMAGFFLVFSFFKLLNLQGFAESYAMYDIVAKKWNVWGYVYAFIELSLGLAYLFKFNLLITNIATFVVMSISIIGVLQSVLNKRKIKCACLGAVFNLPMSTITIIEDGLMIVMSALMLITML